MEIKKGTIVKVQALQPVKVVYIGRVDNIELSTLSISKAIISISDDDFVDIRYRLGDERLSEKLDQCEIIQHGEDFDSIYDIIGRELFK